MLLNDDSIRVHGRDAVLDREWNIFFIFGEYDAPPRADIQKGGVKGALCHIRSIVPVPIAPGTEAVAAVLRMTGESFRLLNRILTQIERILEINGLEEVRPAVAQAARESLVIGQT